MNDIKEIIQVGVDAYKGNVNKYSVNDSMELLQKALIEANGGSTKMNYKNIRDGKCNGLFTIIEEILARTVVDGLAEDSFFMSMVDFRNVALGDENKFVVEDDVLFTVAEAADGTQGIRRQRLNGVTEAVVPTTLKIVKIYDELNRVLSGQIDFNEFIRRVGVSFRQHLLNDIYSVWSAASAAEMGAAFFPAAGNYSEAALLNVIDHVEAAAGGKKATIIGTKQALRKLAPSIQGHDSKNDLYNLGYYGNFYGTEVVALPQRHKIGTTDFVFDNKTVTVIAGDDKPLKVVYEGDTTVIMGDPTSKQDLTQEYFCAEKYGVGIVLAGGNAGVGRYTFTD